MTQDNYEPIKAQIIEICRRLEKMGYFIGTWGNISVRVPEGFIVTPSRVPYDVIQTSDFVVVSNEGKVIAGHRLPSSETEIHRGVLNKKNNLRHCSFLSPPADTTLRGRYGANYRGPGRLHPLRSGRSAQEDR